MSDEKNRLTEIGTIGKAHGLEGTVRVEIFDEAVSLIDEGVLLYLKNRRGDLIPSRIESYRMEEKQNRRLFFVKFDRIADRTEGESFQDTPLYTDLPVYSDEPTNEIDITGYDVYEDSRNIGYVTEILENPAHPIFRVKLAEGGYPGMIMVPAVPEYLLKTDHDNHRLICQNLDRLKEI